MAGAGLTCFNTLIPFRFAVIRDRGTTPRFDPSAPWHNRGGRHQGALNRSWLPVRIVGGFFAVVARARAHRGRFGGFHDAQEGNGGMEETAVGSETEMMDNDHAVALYQRLLCTWHRRPQLW